MKYLVFLKVPEDIERFITMLREHMGVESSSSNNLHCTLMVGRFDEEKESELVEKLETIEFEPFNVGVYEYDCFGDLLVAKLKSPELYFLHNQVIDRLKGYVGNVEPIEGLSEARNKALQTYGSQFFGSFYNPHMTLGSVKNCFDMYENIPKSACKWTVENFVLSKKSLGWQDVKTFTCDTFRSLE